MLINLITVFIFIALPVQHSTLSPCFPGIFPPSTLCVLKCFPFVRHAIFWTPLVDKQLNAEKIAAKHEEIARL